MLHLRIGFPGGRYYAANSDNPGQPEWPPHPSRVYSALVAAAYAGGRQPTDHERQLLHKLESAPPPSLTFPDADLQPAPDSYVPVNDPNTRIRARKLESRGVLHANRQLRQFPAAFLLDNPEIVVSWPLEISTDEIGILDQIAARVTHVGTSHSLVTAQFSRGEPGIPARWIPHPDGDEYLRVPQSGRLDELDQLAGKGHGTLRRPPPRCEALSGYAPAELPGVSVVPSLYDWVSMRLLDASWGADTAHTLARALRRAVLALAGDEAPDFVHGHGTTARHIAWLPLPEVGHVHARGRIRGIAIALPLAVPEPERMLALAAIARLQTLLLPDGQKARLEAVIEGPATATGLRSPTWLRASTHWSTVTPVLLDRPPKRATPEAVLSALAESLVNAGYPVPVSLVATRESDFVGAPGVLDVPTRIPRWHARVEFSEPVRGPVLAGRWRNFGVGLFRPTPLELQA